MSYEGAKCVSGHPLEIISEGHGLCVNEREKWYAWAFTKPANARWWQRSEIIGADGQLIEAWVHYADEREFALNAIAADIAAHRDRPFDEATERARLMPV